MINVFHCRQCNKNVSVELETHIIYDNGKGFRRVCQPCNDMLSDLRNEKKASHGVNRVRK